jgi:alginate O-acetyltransferase complex protein AlgI
MLLHTPFYLIFLLFVVIVHWLLPNKRWRNLFLLVVSYFYYGLFDFRFLFVLVLLTGLIYWIGQLIHNKSHPRIWLWIGVFVNLLVLGYFKYVNFFLDNIQMLLTWWGIQGIAPAVRILLPIGVSFYTFQAISYVLEVYYGRLEPIKNPFDFALYLGFFPKLIAGPLVRPQDFMKQIDVVETQPISNGINQTLKLLFLGLFKKIVIADTLASSAQVAFRAADIPLEDISFASPLMMQGFYLYAFQIYADFSGYTDIARASASLLGYQLPENFKQPYFVGSLTQFWNQWHITLTQWFRSYLFFPLSRYLLLASRRKYKAVIQTTCTMITMLLIGVWHGATWTYIVWGFWNGLLLSIESWLGIKQKLLKNSIFSGILTFHIVGLGWILFRSASLQSAFRYFQELLAFHQMELFWNYLPSILVTAFLVIIIDIYQARGLRISEKYHSIEDALIISMLVIIGGILIIRFAHGQSGNPFIYGQF